MPPQIHVKHSHSTHAFIVLFVAIVAAFVVYGNYKINENIKSEELRKRDIVNKLNNVPVQAKAISVYNALTNEKIYGKNDNVPLPIASLTKIMTIATLVNASNKDDLVTISPEAIKQEGNYGFYVNEEWRVGDLAKITLVTSANDGAYALSTRYLDFLERINEKTHRLGASSANFLNPTGLDTEDDKGNSLSANATASAEDVNQMAMFLLKLNPDIAEATTLPEITLTSVTGYTHTFKNTDIIVDKIPNLLFSKTGYTDLAGGNLTIIFKNQKGESIAVTLLGSTFEGRFADMEALVNILYSL